MLQVCYLVTLENLIKILKEIKSLFIPSQN